MLIIWGFWAEHVTLDSPQYNAQAEFHSNERPDICVTLPLALS